MFKKLLSFFHRWQYVGSIGNVSYYRNRWTGERTCYKDRTQPQTKRDWLWLYGFKDKLGNDKLMKEVYEKQEKEDED